MVGTRLVRRIAKHDEGIHYGSEATRLARQAPGCFDFAQAPDPVDPGRINSYERWESDDHLHAVRTSGGPEPELPPILSADVSKYRIAGVEAP